MAGGYLSDYLGSYLSDYLGGAPAGPPVVVIPVPIPPTGLSVARAARFRGLAPARLDVPRVRRHADRPLDASVREARQALKDLSETKIPFGTPVEVVFTAAATPVRVVHGLPTQPTGYIVVRKSASIQVYDSPPAVVVATDTAALTLEATGAGTVTLWVF